MDFTKIHWTVGSTPHLGSYPVGRPVAGCKSAEAFLGCNHSCNTCFCTWLSVADAVTALLPKEFSRSCCMQGPAVGCHPASLPRLKVQQQATTMLWVKPLGELWLACMRGQIRFHMQHSYAVHVWSQLLPVVFLGKLP